MPNMAQEQQLGTKRGKCEMARAARLHSAQDSSRPKPEEVVGRLTLFGYQMRSAPCLAQGVRERIGHLRCAGLRRDDLASNQREQG
jgi:hypothetical protein